MALTYGAPITRYSVGGRWQVVVPVTLDASYPTGGYAVNAYSLGLPAGLLDVLDANASPDGGYDVRYNSATGNLQAYDTGAAGGAALAEAVNATNLSAVTANCVVTGR